MGRNLHRRHALILALALCATAVHGESDAARAQTLVPPDARPAHAESYTASAAHAESYTDPDKIPYTELFTEGADKTEVASCIQKGKNNLSHKSLCRILEGSEHYRAYIRKRIKEMNLPPCLEYLPIIESGYKPTAKPANGVSMGIWQFMPNSVHPYMELSDYVDERRDPWLSTEGALKKLKENYKQFKDWPLALAAYNCGAGAVSRALKKASEPTFTALCDENLIPLHAQVYVPNFLKVADMIINAEYYGDTELARASHTHHTENTPAGADNARDTDDDYFFYTDFDYVTVNQSIDLNALALEMRLDPKILRELNLSLIKGVTPPGRAYKLRVPAGTALSCLEAINAINNYSKNAEK